jgi:hypothetical protein
MLRAGLISAVALAFAANFATAASAEIVIRSSNEVTGAPVAADQVRVTINLNTFVPAQTDNSDQSQKAEEAGRRTVYEFADHECAILRDTIASECRLDSINVNMQRVAPNMNFPQARPDGFNINSTINFRIVPK